jgi:serine/threonine-protein kinase RsbW
MSDAVPPAPRSVIPVDATPLLTDGFDRGQVTELRHSFASCAEAAGLVGQRLDDFVLAVNELITNAVRHGGGTGELSLWLADDMLVCEVSDDGGGIGAERLSRHDRPAPDTAGGWGLWLADQLSDEMVVMTGPAGTTVRISTSVTDELADELNAIEALE